MISLQALRDKGLTEENLRTWFGGDPKMWDQSTPEAQKRFALHNRLRSRIQEGMTRNFASYRTFYALDRAWTQPFQQITPTLVSGFLDTDPNSDSVKRQLNDWGLSSMLVDETDPKSNTVVKKFNLPVFFNIFVPLVRAYVTIRWAKIMNDRRQTPFFKVEPVKQTTPLRVQCEALTDRMNVMSNQYGYYEVMKQSVLKMLHHSYCLQFADKEWDCEEQWRPATDADVAAQKQVAAPTQEDPKAMRAAVAGDMIKVTEREGLTYHQPHATRLFWDMAHPKFTFNYGYGCKFAGYWRIVRWGDIEDGSYWNKTAVSLGAADLIANNRTFFQTSYAACTLNYAFLPPAPAPTATGTAAAAEMGVGVTQLDRERQIANTFYGTERKDQGVLITEYWEKLVPKDNGLGDYDCPIWMKFTLAGDGGTILYAAPVPYNPVIYYGYDADESLASNPSLSLEILPFQDHFSNTLTQILLTARQNLANMTFVDEEQLPDGAKAKIENLGNSMYQALNVFGFSSRKAYRAQTKLAEVVQNYNLPKGNVAELTNVLKTILDVLERILVMSSHEVAQAASHEQTKEEVRTITASTTTRLQFTATNVDIAASAWKRQIYDGLMAYGDDDMWAHLPSDIPLSKNVLEKMGFTFVDHDGSEQDNPTEIATVRYRRVKFKKSAVALNMWEIAATRDDTDRSSDREVAISMSSLMKDLLANPMLAPAIGPDQALEYANQIARLAGLPRDFKLRNINPQGTEEQKRAEAQQQLMQVIQAVLGQVDQKVIKDIEPLMQKVKDGSDKIQSIEQSMNFILAALKIHPPNPTSQ